MPLVTNFAVGLAATLGLIGLAAVGPGPTASFGLTSSEGAASAEPAFTVNRSAKGDRLATQPKGEAPKAAPVRTLREEKPRPMEGCDPLVSPLAKSSLSEVTGRCIAAREARQKLAMIGR